MKIMKFYNILLSFLMFLLIITCGVGDNYIGINELFLSSTNKEKGNETTTIPEILSISPTDGSNFDGLIPIDVTFSEAVTGAGINSNYIFSGSGVGDLSVDSVNFVTGTTYRIVAKGRPLEGNVILSFSNITSSKGIDLSSDPVNYIGWWNVDWLNRRKLTFDNSAQSENMDNFPVLVKINDPARINYLKTLNNGEDIRFVDDDFTTMLSHEIEEWNESGDSIVWVKVPRIDQSSNTDFIWMYYDNDSTGDGQDVANVWSNNYRLVMHLNETSGNLIDSTSYDNDGVTNGGFAYGASGNFGAAAEFNGSDSYVNAGDDASLEIFNSVTVSMWVKPDAASYGYVLTKDHYSTYAMFVEQVSNFRSYILGSSYAGSFTFPTASWTYIASVYDRTGDYLRLFANDNAPTTFSPGAGVINTTGLDLLLGKRAEPSGNSSGGLYFYDGLMDEIRVANTPRTNDWITAQYDSMNDTLVTYGSEE